MRFPYKITQLKPATKRVSCFPGRFHSHQSLHNHHGEKARSIMVNARKLPTKTRMNNLRRATMKNNMKSFFKPAATSVILLTLSSWAK